MAIWHAVSLCTAIVLLVGLLPATHAEPPTEVRPDGAPGENGFADDAVGQFAQVPEKVAESNDEEAVEAVEADARDKSEDDGGEPLSKRHLDNIDFRTPINRAKQTAWQKIEQAAEGRDWSEVLDRLERFAGPIDRPPTEDHLVRQADGSLKSARLSIARLAGSLPANLRASRTRTESTLGNTLLEQAMRENDLRQLSHVAVRFFGTPVGYRAADRLAAQLIDRGEFALAAEWMKLLRASDAEINRSAAWQTRLRLVLTLTENPQKPNAQSEPFRQLREQFVSVEPAAISQWPLLGGNAQRFAEPNATSRPVMIRRWEFPATSSSGLKLTIDRLIEDLMFQAVPTVPAGIPIYVNGRLICRTFRGIEVLDAESGQHLWSTAQSDSVERLLGNSSAETLDAADLMPQMTPLISGTTAVDRTGGPIGQFLFQNAAHGLISSDGRTVYFLDDDPVFTLGRTSIRRVDGGNASPRPDSTTSNRLKAHDLQSGEPVWQIGGPATREPFAPELAGWFFLGAPLPHRGDLFIVGQKENTIRLFCLDPDNGSARWSQQIAFAEEGLERNLNRRLWSVQLAAVHGVIVCPTSVGWLVGVDRSTGTILWSHRYSKRQPDGATGTPGMFRGNRGRIELANEPIGGSWIPAAPIIMGDRIVFTPSEPTDEADDTTRLLDCVNVFSGQRIWSQPRNNALAVNGATRGQIVITRTNAVVILNPDGSTRAEIEFDPEDGLPCGRGVVAGESFWLPLQKQVLVKCDLVRGSLTERIKLASGYPPLGNLTFYQGMLISHAPEGLSAWELEGTLDARLATIRADGDSDKADILEAQLALSRKEYSTAIDILLPRLSKNLNAGIHKSILGLLMQAASGQMESRPESGLALLEKIQPLFESAGIEGANFELQRRHLQIEALLRLNQPAGVFEKLLELVTLPSGDTLKRVDDPRITVSVDPWLSRQLQRAWLRLSAAEQKESRTRIEKLIAQRSDHPNSPLSPERLALLFAFHDGSVKLVHQLAEEALSEGRFVAAEHWLNTIITVAAKHQAAEALVRRIRLRIEHHIIDTETRRLVRQLETEYSAVNLPDATSVSTLLPTLQQRVNGQSTWKSPDWGQFTLSSVRTASSHQREEYPRSTSDRSSSRFYVETQDSGTGSRRLSFLDRTTNDLFWTVSLRANNSQSANESQQLSIYQSGQFFPVLSDGVLNMLSVPERRVLWTQPVHSLDSARLDASRHDKPLEDVAEWMARVRPGSGDAVPVVNSQYVCSRGSRSLTVFDSRTGTLRWRLEPFERGFRVFGTHDTVYLARPDGTITSAHNAVDGEPVEIAAVLLDQRGTDAIARVDDRAIITVTRDDEASAVTLRAVSPATHAELWSHALVGKLKVRLISSNELALLASGGRLHILNFESGTLTQFAKIPTRLRLGNPDYSLLTDGRIVYVILKRESTENNWRPGLENVLINGPVVAYDRSSGDVLWTREDLSGQYLLTERLDQLPFLITTSHRREILRQPPEVRRIVVLDKRDGEVLLDTRDEPGEAGFHSLLIDASNRQVDLISIVERFRLKAVPLENATAE